MTRAKKMAILKKLHEAALYVFEMLFVLAYIWGVEQHSSTVFGIGLCGMILYLPFWCYLDDLIIKIGAKYK